jgi:hypothetical protein
LDASLIAFAVVMSWESIAMIADRHSHIPANEQNAPEYRSAEDVAAPKATEDDSATHATDDLEHAEVAEPDTLTLLVKQFHELGEYVSYYVTAKTDSAKLSVRNTVLWIALAAMGFIVVAALIITATWLLLNGIAEGVSVLLGGRVWVGNIVTGVLLLVGLGLAIYSTMTIRRITSRERVVCKYEQRQAQQQEQFGRNVRGPKADTASHEK